MAENYWTNLPMEQICMRISFNSGNFLAKFWPTLFSINHLLHTNWKKSIILGHWASLKEANYNIKSKHKSLNEHFWVRSIYSWKYSYSREVTAVKVCQHEYFSTFFLVKNFKYFDTEIRYGTIKKILLKLSW